MRKGDKEGMGKRKDEDELSRGEVKGTSNLQSRKKR